MNKQLKRMDVIASVQPKRSLNNCLLTLGASVSEVYGPWYLGPSHKRRKRLYDRYTISELKTWAKSLFRESIKNNHPDMGGNKKQAREIIEAYRRAVKILAFK